MHIEMICIGSLGILVLASVAFGKVYFEENFDNDSSTERWTWRTGRSFGNFERSTRNYYGNSNNMGIKTIENGPFYALSTHFPEFSPGNRTFVVQFNLKFEKHPTDCVQASISLNNCDLEPFDSLTKDSQNAMEFGLVMCMTDKFIFVTVNLEQQQRVNGKIEWQVNEYTHVYTLIINPDLSYYVLVDGEHVSNNKTVKKLQEPQNHGQPWNATLMNTRICGIEFDIYQSRSVNSTILDNVLVTDDIDHAQEIIKDVIVETEAEKKMKQLQDEAARLKLIRSTSIIDIDPEDLTSIFEHKGSLEFKSDNTTENFLLTYNKFLIPFNWTSNNTVIQATAHYNRNRSAANSSLDPIQLWVSFQPRKDISVDIDSVMECVNAANSLHPKTVAVILINYRFLRLYGESLSLVKHEIGQVHKRLLLKSLQGQVPKLGLQVSDQNCLGIYKNLDNSLVDILVVMPMGKEFSVNGSVTRGADWIFCLVTLNLKASKLLPVLHTHVSIRINLTQGIYKYDRIRMDIPREYHFRKDLVHLIHANAGKGKTVSTDIASISMHTNFVNWLYQPSDFSKLDFRAFTSFSKNISHGENYVSAVVANFRYILIDGSNDDSGSDDDNLKLILDEISNYTRFANKQANVVDSKYHISKDDLQPQLSILVRIGSSDFEVNKRQADKAIRAAVQLGDNSIVTVNKIFFDWMACSRSEICSGSSKQNISNESCFDSKMHKNFSKILNYANEAVQNISKSSKVSIGATVDSQFFLNDSQRSGTPCEGPILFGYRGAILCKIVVHHKDLVKYGAPAAFKIVIDDMCSQTKRMNPDHFSLFVNVIGCDGDQHSNMTVLVEYARLMEYLNNWAIAENISLFTNAGVEFQSKCGQDMEILEMEKDCQCGWWIQQQTTNGIYQDKKTIARLLYENAGKIPEPDDDNSKTVLVPQPASMLWLLVLIPAIGIAILVTTSAVFLVFRYQAKYILTKQQVAKFIRGRQATRNNDPVADGEESAKTQSYNSEKYELACSSFTIDILGACLGYGEFARVYRGSIRRDGATIEAAVKMTNPNLVGKSHGYYMALKGLLSEIKILAYVGQHEHIVGLLGAYTQNIRKGRIAVFLQFCQLGSLEKYLHSMKPQIVDGDINSAVGSRQDYANIAEGENHGRVIAQLDKESSTQLYRWAGEIATGMEFLASKKLVHADLACRNILLTSDKIAKISDFGLSRRLYDYSEYIKRSQEPLPWRWMAPEALCRSVFNEKTDIWAFGVTLWEMFTLGDLPYSGLSWNVNFPQLLQRGLCPPEPRYNVKDVYSVMMQCWNVSPRLRLTFSQVNYQLNQVD